MIKGMKRVAGGPGGDALVLIGSEKTAVLDCGMAYCAPRMIEQVKEVLKGRTLDYMFSSHTHYDHIGGLAYLRQEWPNIISVGNAHGQAVLKRSGALKAIRKLSESAAKEYMKESYEPLEYRDEDLRIDYVVKDGDVISLGDRHLLVMETPGHTNCSLSYYLEEERFLFPSESIGCYVGNHHMVSPILTGFQDTITSIQRCRELNPKWVSSPHYGVVRNITPQQYFDLAVQAAVDMKEFILEIHHKGMTQEEMIQACQERYWNGETANEQPLMAFLVNTKAAISVICKEFGEDQ
ncbi:MBL fold metallo-hydrolase [Sinanaerobacter sp. ZZT-01]|uniref:MBL fold metallo-hydrolase n=1 Tax=Sinanaerobacter sp. ZZT-01 TaxID=3111540 RepID=UPI002D796CF4|nr:MBL fold metallo-hydrolase [Sinanaerobacter sp. ZZT-01]WRR93327.1 MBL fold metallo-hydrolase [Sinanaerobacter sp. ZZT-01]